MRMLVALRILAGGMLASLPPRGLASPLRDAVCTGTTSRRCRQGGVELGTKDRAVQRLSKSTRPSGTRLSNVDRRELVRSIVCSVDECCAFVTEGRLALGTSLWSSGIRAERPLTDEVDDQRCTVPILATSSS